MSRRITPITRRVTVEPISAPPNLTMKEQHQHQTFPYKLYEMLEYACDSEFSSSLSWSADGSCFIIHDKEVMMDDLAPMFFKQTKFRSFVSVVGTIFFSQPLVLILLYANLAVLHLSLTITDTATEHLGLCSL
jgi:uncharacterized protein (DUF927 family)